MSNIRGRNNNGFARTVPLRTNNCLGSKDDIAVQSVIACGLLTIRAQLGPNLSGEKYRWPVDGKELSSSYQRIEPIDLSRRIPSDQLPSGLVVVDLRYRERVTTRQSVFRPRPCPQDLLVIGPSD
jgi:hypothetical protein